MESVHYFCRRDGYTNDYYVLDTIDLVSEKRHLREIVPLFDKFVNKFYCEGGGAIASKYGNKVLKSQEELNVVHSAISTQNMFSFKLDWDMPIKNGLISHRSNGVSKSFIVKFNDKVMEFACGHTLTLNRVTFRVDGKPIIHYSYDGLGGNYFTLHSMYFRSNRLCIVLVSNLNKNFIDSDLFDKFRFILNYETGEISYDFDSYGSTRLSKQSWINSQIALEDINKGLLEVVLNIVNGARYKEKLLEDFEKSKLIDILDYIAYVSSIQGVDWDTIFYIIKLIYKDDVKNHVKKVLINNFFKEIGSNANTPDDVRAYCAKAIFSRSN